MTGRQSRTARPDGTSLVVVGVERYAAGAAWDLPGPAVDARRFADWFWSIGVRPERTMAFVSALPGNEASWRACPAPVQVQEATRERVRAALVRTVAETDGDLLIVVWGGHGMVGATGRRHLFTADATGTDPLNVDVDGVLKLHRSSAIRSFAHQLWVVDTCQTLHDGARSRLDLPWEDFGVRDIMPGRVQEVLFAASPGERAANLLGERTGLFSRELLSHLKNSGGQWPPDVAGLADRLREQFTALRARGLARQTPTYLWFQDRTGREGQLLAAVSGSAGPQPPGEPVTPPPGGLAPLVDTLVAVPGFQSIDFRDELVTLLRQEIGNSIPRFNRARLEAASLVQTCARFPGGLTELQEAIRLCAGEVPEVRAFAAAVEAAG